MHSGLSLLQTRQQMKGCGARSITAVILRIPNLDSVRQYLETGNPVKHRIGWMSNHRDASLPRDRGDNFFGIIRLRELHCTEAKNMYALLAFVLKTRNEKE